MPDQAKIDEMVDIVLARTQDRTLEWTETADDEVFSVVIESGPHILKSYGYSERPDDSVPSLSIFSGSNRLLVDISGATINSSRSAKLRKIYNLAKGQATGADDAVDDIISALQEIKVTDEDIPF